MSLTHGWSPVPPEMMWWPYFIQNPDLQLNDYNWSVLLWDDELDGEYKWAAPLANRDLLDGGGLERRFQAPLPYTQLISNSFQYAGIAFGWIDVPNPDALVKAYWSAKTWNFKRGISTPQSTWTPTEGTRGAVLLEEDRDFESLIPRVFSRNVEVGNQGTYQTDVGEANSHRWELAVPFSYKGPNDQWDPVVDSAKAAKWARNYNQQRIIGGDINPVFYQIEPYGTFDLNTMTADAALWADKIKGSDPRLKWDLAQRGAFIYSLESAPVPMFEVNVVEGIANGASSKNILAWGDFFGLAFTKTTTGWKMLCKLMRPYHVWNTPWSTFNFPESVKIVIRSGPTEEGGQITWTPITDYYFNASNLWMAFIESNDIAFSAFIGFSVEQVKKQFPKVLTFVPSRIQEQAQAINPNAEVVFFYKNFTFIDQYPDGHTVTGTYSNENQPIPATPFSGWASTIGDFVCQIVLWTNPETGIETYIPAPNFNPWQLSANPSTWRTDPTTGVFRELTVVDNPQLITDFTQRLCDYFNDLRNNQIMMAGNYRILDENGEEICSAPIYGLPGIANLNVEWKINELFSDS